VRRGMQHGQRRQVGRLKLSLNQDPLPSLLQVSPNLRAGLSTLPSLMALEFLKRLQLHRGRWRRSKSGWHLEE